MNSAECNICGQAPVGEGCYHLCQNSTHYYSSEQERFDDQFYGEDDIRERYADELILDWDEPDDTPANWPDEDFQSEADFDHYAGAYEVFHVDEDVPF